MIAYFDTSAFVPLLVREAGSAAAAVVWNGALRVASTRLLYVEARAALAQARRLGRLTAAQLRAAVTELDGRYPQVELVEVDDHLVRDAGELAESHHLRGYDAVHLAAARRLASDDLVLIAGDRALLTAAEAIGLTVAATS